MSPGLLHGSSILLDESRSQMNARLVGNASRHDFPYLNILEVRMTHGGDMGPTTPRCASARRLAAHFFLLRVHACQVDNICDHGPQLWAAIKAAYPTLSTNATRLV